MKKLVIPITDMLFFAFLIKALILPDYATTLIIFGLIGLFVFRTWFFEKKDKEFDSLKSQVEEIRTKINALTLQKSIIRNSLALLFLGLLIA